MLCQSLAIIVSILIHASSTIMVVLLNFGSTINAGSLSCQYGRRGHDLCESVNSITHVGDKLFILITIVLICSCMR